MISTLAGFKICEITIERWLRRLAADRRPGVSPGPRMQEAGRIRDGLERDAPATQFIPLFSKDVSRDNSTSTRFPSKKGNGSPVRSIPSGLSETEPGHSRPLRFQPS